MKEKYKIDSEYFQDLIDLEPDDPAIAAKLARDLAKMEDHRKTIRGATMEVTCQPIIPGLPDPDPALAASNRLGSSLKVQSSLKPSKLSSEANMCEFGV